MSNANSPAYSIGLDYGTNSVRCLVVRTSDGAEIGTHVFTYSTGEEGVILDAKNSESARQFPLDYLEGAEVSVQTAIARARDGDTDFAPDRVVGIGVDTTGSTPMPVDREGRALVESTEFASNPNAMAWLWKDHTAIEEAGRITQHAREQRPNYLQKCGGAYSSEWFWSKIWHCTVVAPEVSAAAASWIEIADWIPAVLTGNTRKPIRGICQAGHKGLYHRDWGGYPEAEFLAELDSELGRVRLELGEVNAVPIDHAAGELTSEWAEKLGLLARTPVAVGALDAHLGAVGSGIQPGTLVKILGTSTCDIIVSALDQELPFIPGLCGIVPESVLPGCHGLEAGQSAVGDIFNWWVKQVKPGGGMSHEELTREAEKLRPGESGLLALDWNNGNRTVLVDPQLTGLLLGQTLQTRPDEIYRALIEATAFGARIIMERIEEYGVRVERVVNCGGIAEKNPMLMQIYADVTGREMQIARSPQACGLGAAIAGAVVGGAHPDVASAQAVMAGIKDRVYRPNNEHQIIYEKLFALYGQLHDAFGMQQTGGPLANVMKDLLAIRDGTRAGRQE